jgi:DNA-binding CsgD family transcriptional regulator
MKKKINPIIEVPKGTFQYNEEVRPINPDILNGSLPVHDLYVSDKGRIFKEADNRLQEVLPSLDRYGYIVVNYMNTDGERKQVKAHRAILGTFDPLPKEEMKELTVNHVDGYHKTNNRLSNLEWLGNGDNVRDASKQGLMRNALTDGEIIKIINLAKRGLSDEEISDIMKGRLTPGSVGAVRRGDGDFGKRLEAMEIEPVKMKRMITDEDYPMIYNMIDKGMNDNEIADIIGCNRGTIASIRRGDTDYYAGKLNQYNRSSVAIMSKITDDIIITIHTLSKQGMSDEAISEKINIPLATVSCIRSGQAQYIDRIRALGLSPIRISTNSTISDDDIRAIIKYAREGKKDSEISEILGFSKATIATIRQGGNVYAKKLRDLGLQPCVSDKPKLTDNEYRAIIRYAQEGKSDEEIGEIFNKSAKMIQCIRTGQDNYKNILNRLGLEPVKHERVYKRGGGQ